MSKSQKNKCAPARGADFKSTRQAGENQSCDAWCPAFSPTCGLGWPCCPRTRDWEGKDGSHQPHGTCADNCINGMKSFQCCKNTDFLEEVYSTYLLSAGPRWTDGETAARRMLTFRDSPSEWVQKSGVGGVGVGALSQGTANMERE